MFIKIVKKRNITSYYLQLIPTGAWYKIGYNQYLMHKENAKILS